MKKFLSILFVITMVFTLSVTGCDFTDDSDDSDETSSTSSTTTTTKSIDIKVTFNGTTKPAVDDKLMVVAWGTMDSLEESVLNDADPDTVKEHTLTADDITNGVTVTLESKDDDKGYFGAYSDINGQDNMNPGDLVEIYDNVTFADYQNAKEVEIKDSITIDLDQVVQ